MNVRSFQKNILSWHDLHARTLPWRSKVPNASNPYHVWLSEIMLQQTTVATVGPYFMKFIQKWPTIGDLSSASLDDVLHVWQGLGYYARARNLHKCAQVFASKGFPETPEALQAFPGIGPYTAAAISSIAFNYPAPVMDSNIERIMARVFWVQDPLPAAKKVLYTHVSKLTPRERPGDYAQALMDLASTVCTPKSPKCGMCPIHDWCRAALMPDPSIVPVKVQKVRPVRYGTVFWLENAQEEVWIRKRPEKGLLAGLMEIPSTNWRDTARHYAEEMIMDLPWQSYPGAVSHIFTHFHLKLNVVKSMSDHAPETPGIWVHPSEFPNYAFSTLMKKVIQHICGS